MDSDSDSDSDSGPMDSDSHLMNSDSGLMDSDSGHVDSDSLLDSWVWTHSNTAFLQLFVCLFVCFFFFLMRNFHLVLTQVGLNGNASTHLKLALVAAKWISSDGDTRWMKMWLVNVVLNHKLWTTFSDVPSWNRIFIVDRRHESSPLLKSLHWLPVKQRITYKLLLYVYKALNGLAPMYISNCLKLYVPKRNLRSSSDCLRLDYPITRNKAGDRTFTVYASKLWNNLPMTLRNCTSVKSRKHLRHICSQINCSLWCSYFIMYVYYFSASVSALSLLGMAYQILVVCMYVCIGC